MCGAWELELSMTPEVAIQGVGLDDPFSKPGLLSNCWVVPPPPLTVKLIVVVCVLPPPEPLINTL